jgi:DNA-binding winged helix-turn-helix (wHTH) protein
MSTHEEGSSLTNTDNINDNEQTVFAHQFAMGESMQTFTVDYSKKLAKVGDVSIHLSGKEYEILEFLTKHAGKIHTRTELLNHLYAGKKEPELKILDVFACKLRKKLNNLTGSVELIGTAWGRGYYFGELKPTVIDVPSPSSPESVLGPQGDMITLGDLPAPGTFRWVINRKAVLVCVIRGGLLSLEAALGRYPGLTAAEVIEWTSAYDRHGLPGLRATRIQQYEH